MKRDLEKNRNLSVSNKYFLFVMVVLVSVSLLLAYFYYYTYNNDYLNNRNKKLQIGAVEISSEINSIFEENENILRFFGKKISKNIGEKDLQGISDLLTSTEDLNIKKMTRSYISWANPEGEVVVSGKEGVLKDNFPDITRRKYYVTAREKPWALQISDPTKSLFSQGFVLPTAMGVANDKEKFIGYLVLGLRIEHINQLLSDIGRAEKMGFIVLNDHWDLIFKSLNNAENLEKSFDKNKLFQLIKNEKGFFSKPLSLAGVEYYYYAKTENYPYVILVGIDKSVTRKEFLYYVAPRLFEFLLLGIFFSIVVFLYRKKIIKLIAKDDV